MENNQNMTELGLKSRNQVKNKNRKTRNPSSDGQRRSSRLTNNRDVHTSSRQSANLKRHIEGVDKKIKDFQFTYSTSSLTKPKHLKTHIKGIHEEIKKFQCSNCSSSFTNHGHLKRHIEGVHEKIKNTHVVTALVLLHNLET
uniref:C2H2-type domain-containing protein n=1 Tax=Lepeophtheirus salmonis TaxID=72036 RepID=A0A0K2TU58_LEPSM